MPALPGSDTSLLVRTDFASDDAWQQLSDEAQRENEDGFRAYLELVNDPGFDRANGELLYIAYTGAWRLPAEAVRERQAVALTHLDARHRTALPTIIAFDFNAGPHASSIRYLRGLQSLNGHSVHYHDAWQVAAENSGTADPGADPAGW